MSFYIFTPAFTFVNLYTTDIPLEMMKVIMATILVLLINALMVSVVSKIKGYNEGLKNALINSVMFLNSGNIGIPLITLVFSSPPFVVNGETPYLSIALTTQVIIMVLQNVIINTVGFLNAGRANSTPKECIIKVLRMPTIYTIPLALILKTMPYDMTSISIWPALDYARDALVPISLISLGVQLSKTTFEFGNKKVYLAVDMRLFGGPVLALILVYLFQMEGIIGQVLVIASALPSAVNTALIAVEFDNYPNLASQVVAVSTLFSAITLVFIIYTARLLFPIV